MIRRFAFRTFILALALTMSAALTQAAKLSPTLQTTLASAANSAPVGVVIVSFNTSNGLNDTHLAILRGVGLTKGLNAAQVSKIPYWEDLFPGAAGHPICNIDGLGASATATILDEYKKRARAEREGTRTEPTQASLGSGGY